MSKKQIYLNYAFLLNDLASNFEKLYRYYMDHEKDANDETLLCGVNDLIQTTFDSVKKDYVGK